MHMQFLRFGPSITTTFIDGDGKRVSSTYLFQDGPSGKAVRTNNDNEENGRWELTFDEPAGIQFSRGKYYFRRSTAVKTGSGYEMFITLMFKKVIEKETIVYTIKEL